MNATMKSHLGTFTKKCFNKSIWGIFMWKATRVIQVKRISQRYGCKWSSRDCRLEVWASSLLLVFDLVLLQTVAVRRCAWWQTFFEKLDLLSLPSELQPGRHSLIVHCETHNVTTQWRLGLGDTTATVYLSNKHCLLFTFLFTDRTFYKTKVS